MRGFMKSRLGESVFNDTDIADRCSFPFGVSQSPAREISCLTRIYLLVLAAHLYPSRGLVAAKM